ncbi:anti-sigma F factor antagonist [Planotetraspora thailandica]|uniref:Anti-sigma factor antagonist n=1 Tax=Planotetraspora thailandica TaxID=487172 RepID=A0A8J3Y084_9ACTN|nr:STAS domain-containing protein [Planotetraspora thailandica]GII58415.1 anti-sigma F factor antagonist [Planotetraspora thailandica]
MQEFRVSTERRPPFTVIHVCGELDIATEPRLREEVQAALAHPTPRLLFDLTRLDFVDSTGLQIIFDTYVELGRGDRVAVCGLSPRVKKVFDALGLTAEMAVYGTAAEVMASLGTDPW